MNNLVVKGMQNIEGMKFHDIEGGFGEGKKAMLVKEIANIHGRELKAINQNINNNIERFRKNIDIIDLKNGHFKLPLQELGLSNRDISISKNIYLLSERGYSKLLKILEDDVAWEQYDKLVDGYFQMRAERNNKEYEDLSTEMKALLMHDKKIQAVEKKINEVDDRFEDLPLIGGEPEELQKTVKKVGTRALGGYGSPAYNDKSLSRKVYSNVWKHIKEQFDVNTYKAIKRKYLSKAKEIAEEYEAPFYLREEINLLNNQGTFK